MECVMHCSDILGLGYPLLFKAVTFSVIISRQPNELSAVALAKAAEWSTLSQHHQP